MHFAAGICFFLQAFALVTLRADGQKKKEEGASADEVQMEVVHVPENCHPKSKKGDLLNAHYDGYLAGEKSKFYCSRTQNNGHPKWFVLGVGQVIKGLDIAMLNMCPGEKRKVIIPPSLAYGEQGYGKARLHVKANSHSLYFSCIASVYREGTEIYLSSHFQPLPYMLLIHWHFVMAITIHFRFCCFVPSFKGTQVALWVKPLSLGLADQKVGGSNPRDGVRSRCLVSAPANLAARKHVKVQVDK
ncbi:peptidyl-prolyl cis-trans isomerase FKBP7 isoform X1 [Zootoca vivipara]|uniref:peptidyl-prolyl cis-trans isomerase FKBP7 isoform X1 n=1 Tax=Zootoca vivipara TaxID=8524 RepID=UPI00293BE17C|nr:peptidyl-prolyl cis-trans isomerase FKBP7 isoform X1 [Zootoca vivipara]